MTRDSKESEMTEKTTLQDVLEHHKELIKNLKPGVIITTGVQQPRVPGEGEYPVDDKPHFTDYPSYIRQG